MLRLQDDDRPKRFLVADEVGLGKTIIAQGVMHRLLRTHPEGRPFRAVYVCSNLGIAAQNMRELLDVHDSAKAIRGVDRLTMLPIQFPTGEFGTSAVQVMPMTPATSLPRWRRGSRYGRKKERVWVEALLCELLGRGAVPSLDPSGRLLRYAENVRDARCELQKDAGKQRVRGFRDAIQTELQDDDELHKLRRLAAEGQGLGTLARERRAQLAGCCRNALAMQGLAMLAPDLVIFDEFQRFMDLVDPEGGGQSAHVLARLRGDDPTVPLRVLLLSATPYRLYARRGDGGAVEEFYRVVQFLAGHTSLVRAHRERAARTTQALRKHLAALRSCILGRLDASGARPHRDAAEALLQRLMCRTERSDALWRLGEDLRAPHDDLPQAADQAREPVTRAELEVFRHYVDERRRASGRPAVPGSTTFWASIPLPAQTMHGYASGVTSPRPTKALLRAGAWLDSGRAKQLDRRPLDAHPRLRALRREVPAASLALPWCAPSRPWWPLAGAWKEGGPEKVLLFSRFRAVPRTLGALLSYEAEAEAVLRQGRRTRPKRLPRVFRMGPKPALNTLLLFVPVRALAMAVHPCRSASRARSRPRTAVRKQALRGVTSLAKTIAGKLGASGPGRLRLHEGSKTTSRAKALARLAAAAREAGVAGFEGLLDLQWLRRIDPAAATTLARFEALVADVTRALRRGGTVELGRRDLLRLSELGLAAPGNVLLRACSRHWSDPSVEVVGHVSWRSLRGYLGHPIIADRLRPRATSTEQRRRYRTVLPQAILDGGFESVLDEALWQLARTPEGRELPGAMTRVGRWLEISVAPGGRAELLTDEGRLSLRCHAAMPMQGIRGARTSSEGAEKPPRPDELRLAFNSPFWPHVLCTTSVGQEGLDLHLWCRRIAHWDLPSNPVDLEQREGRIQRHGSLSVRRGLVEKASRDGVDLGPPRRHRGVAPSPWVEIQRFADALSQASPTQGLSPWWLLPESTTGEPRIQKLYLPVALSRQEVVRRHLARELELYRLVLGQPDQERLVEELRLRGDDMAESALRLRLSPSFGETEAP